MQADIGLIGLGVMGSNLALNIAEKGFTIAVYNRGWEVTEKFMADAGDLAQRIIACRTLDDLAAAIEPPRPVIMMITAGAAVDQVTAQLLTVLAPNDIIIDAGNSDFHDTVRREAEVSRSGRMFIGMGVSGGEEGARHGPSIMVGGPEASYRRVEKLLTAIAADYKGEPCCAWVGPDGAGHFVKTMHNGIEYADMQMIAEIYGIMRDGLSMQASEMAQVFAAWNAGKLDSYLIEITAKVLATTDAATGKPLVDEIVDSAAQKGTGKWSVIAAQTLETPATTLEAAVAARVLSSKKDERVIAERAYGMSRQKITPESRTAYLQQLESALYAAKIAAYAQGFAVMEQASAAKGWHIPLASVASIWRAGCIIRSQFLDAITASFRAGGGKGNLLLAADFVAAMTQNQSALRRTAADAALAGLPVPALSAALSYFDGYRQGRGTANLIQGQRDFFGAHTFQRIGMEGPQHADWQKTMPSSGLRHD